MTMRFRHSSRTGRIDIGFEGGSAAASAQRVVDKAYETGRSPSRAIDYLMQSLADVVDGAKLRVQQELEKELNRIRVSRIELAQQVARLIGNSATAAEVGASMQRAVDTQRAAYARIHKILNDPEYVAKHVVQPKALAKSVVGPAPALVKPHPADLPTDELDAKIVATLFERVTREGGGPSAISFVQWVNGPDARAMGIDPAKLTAAQEKLLRAALKRAIAQFKPFRKDIDLLLQHGSSRPALHQVLANSGRPTSEVGELAVVVDVIESLRAEATRGLGGSFPRLSAAVVKDLDALQHRLETDPSFSAKQAYSEYLRIERKYGRQLTAEENQRAIDLPMPGAYSPSPRRRVSEARFRRAMKRRAEALLKLDPSDEMLQFIVQNFDRLAAGHTVSRKVRLPDGKWVEERFALETHIRNKRTGREVESHGVRFPVVDFGDLRTAKGHVTVQTERSLGTVSNDQVFTVGLYLNRKLHSALTTRSDVKVRRRRVFVQEITMKDITSPDLAKAAVGEGELVGPAETTSHPEGAAPTTGWAPEE